MTDGDDHDLLHAWRGAAQETPGDLLDRRILAVARAHRARRLALPLAAAMAACLVLALYAERPQMAAPPKSAAMPDPATYGLYAGREVALLSDPVAMKQVMGAKGLRHPTGEFVTP
jgi:hypothetical protein